MKVSDILGAKGNAVATIRPEAKISTVVRRLKLEGIGAMVVSEDSVQVVGIISERDIVRGLVEDGAELLEKRVLDLMTSPVKKVYSITSANSGGGRIWAKNRIKRKSDDTRVVT